MDFWQWFTLIGGIIGLVAFVMSVQPFTQAIWGNPRIEITFKQLVKDNGDKVLYFDIINKFISRGILQKLAVWLRTAEGLCADYYIYDSTGKQQLMEEIGAEMEMAEIKQKQISLPASMIWAYVDVVKTSIDGISSIPTTPNITPIHIGLYKILVVVRYEGKLVRRQHLFTVGDKPDGTYWVNVS